MNAYQKYTKINPEKMETERNRLKTYLNDKYKNNEEYRMQRRFNDINRIQENKSNMMALII